MSDSSASQLTSASTEAKSSIWNFNSKSKMRQVEVEEWLAKIQPQNVIVFYRNQIQSASTIKINVKKMSKIVDMAENQNFESNEKYIQQTIKRKSSKPQPKTSLKDKRLSTISSAEENEDVNKSNDNAEGVKFKLQTTNSKNYRVSEFSGIIRAEQKVKYINIMINSQTSLQNCLRDKFKLLITLPGKPPNEYQYKVIIDYKKDFVSSKYKDLGRLQLASRTASSSHLNSAESVLGNPLTIVKKSLMKKNQLVNYLGNGYESERVNMKQNLDTLIKQVNKSRIRLEYLDRQIQKNKSRRRFMLYITVGTILFFFVCGIIAKKLVILGWKYSQTEQQLIFVQN